MRVQKKIQYQAEAADTGADGKQVRIVAELEGRYSRYRSPRHVATLSEEQACELRDSLNEVLDS